MTPTISFQRAAAFIVLLVAAIIPTLLVKIPAMEDYLDHLGRMYILATAGTSEANPHYHVSWAIYPDIAMDIVVPLLGRYLDIETAAWIFFFASQLLIVTGAIALELVVKGRHELAGFASLLTLYSLPFSLGLLNFEFGTGIALWGVASWIALSRHDSRRFRFIAHIGFSIVLFLSHFYALGIYGLTLGLLELRRLLSSRSTLSQSSFAFLELASPVIVMLWLMKESGGAVGENDYQWWFSWKPLWFGVFLNGYSTTLAAGSVAVLIVLLSYSVLTRSLSISAEGKWIGAGFLLIFLMLPFKFFGSRMADVRMITAALLILPAFITVSFRAKPLAYLIHLVVFAVIITNTSYVTYIWLSYRSDYEAMKSSFTRLHEGSFVLVGNARSETPSTLLTDAPFFRAPTLAVYHAKAFVSTLYTVRGTHAVTARSDLHRLEVNNVTENYTPPSLATLKAISEGRHVPAAPRYVEAWTRDFDYLYLLGPHVPNALPEFLDELVAERRFTLYHIHK